MKFRFPLDPMEPDESNAVEAVALHTDAPQTSTLSTGSAMVNKLWSNILWGQRSNFVGVPTDCPLRDERLGWPMRQMAHASKKDNDERKHADLFEKIKAAFELAYVKADGYVGAVRPGIGSGQCRASSRYPSSRDSDRLQR